MQPKRQRVPVGADSQVLVPVPLGLRLLMARRAKTLGISGAEAWRRAARHWLLLDAAMGATAGASPLAEEKVSLALRRPGLNS